MIDRLERVSALIKREISVILQAEIDDPRIGDVTITHVDVSRDLRSSRVFCLLDGDADTKRDSLKGLRRASKRIRMRLAESIKLKFMPKLNFIEDTDEIKRQRIASVFDTLKNENEEKNGNSKALENS